MIKITIDTKQVTSHVKRLMADVNRTAEENVMEIARLGAIQLATKTKPHGITGHTKKVLQGAVRKDVSRAYWSVGRTYNELKVINPKLANAFAAEFHKGNTQKAEDIVKKVIQGYTLRSGDSGSYLESVRNHNGRVDDNVTPMGLTSNGAISKLKAKKMLTAGTAKSGFIQAGESVGKSVSVQSWLKKKSKLGTSRKQFSKLIKKITLINHVRYVSKLISQGDMNAAMASAMRSNQGNLTRQLNAATRKF
jgi:hypothetical protein